MNPNLKLGDVTTVNITVVSGGVQFNVVPSEMSVKVDMRIAPTDSHEVLCVLCLLSVAKVTIMNISLDVHTMEIINVMWYA